MGKISIVCPECKARLSVPDIPNIREKIIACPKCHFRAQVSVYMAGAAARGGQGADEDSTQLPGAAMMQKIVLPGAINVISSGAVMSLKVGHNIIGRKADTSTADIQIPGDPYMSRQHVDIEVVKGANGLEHRLNEINSKNIVSLNGAPIDRGDVIKLKFGDVLTLGKTDVKLIEEDDDSTRIA